MFKADLVGVGCARVMRRDGDEVCRPLIAGTDLLALNQITVIVGTALAR
jgi:hypothetical protein